MVSAVMLTLLGGQSNTSTPTVKSNINISSNTSDTNETIPDIPLNLEIPSIGVNAKIEQVGLTKEGAVSVPKGPSTTGWFNLGSKPGELGSSVIDGHYGPWQDGSNSVFDNISKLKLGDKIYVRDKKGQVFVFTVIDKKTYEPNAIVPEIFNKNDDRYLNLITCSGDWLAKEQTYNKRLVIFAKADK